VLLVDDHRLMRQVLRVVVEGEPDLCVVGSASDAESALAVIDELTPDVVLMDLELPGMNGIEATRQLVSVHPLVRVVMLSASCSRALVVGALTAGASGYLLKEGPPEQLLNGIRDVVCGHRPLAPTARALLDA
jgi:DNA-binding NarL/FixJ family response regulator